MYGACKERLEKDYQRTRCHLHDYSLSCHADCRIWSFVWSSWRIPITTVSVGVVNLGTSNAHHLHISFRNSRQHKSTEDSVLLRQQDRAICAGQGTVQGVLVIPSSFDASIQSYKDNPGDSSRWVNSTLILYLDKASLISAQVLPSVVQQVFASEILNQNAVSTASPVRGEEPLHGARQGAPGLWLRHGGKRTRRGDRQESHLAYRSARCDDEFLARDSVVRDFDWARARGTDRRRRRLQSGQ